MAKVIFYEMPGCGGNARQKALLRQSGHDVEVRNLLATAWTPGELRSYFGSRPVAQWFNAASPRVKSGEVDPAGFTDTQALSLMIADPLLIRRPLMEADDRREVGFDAALVDQWIGLRQSAEPVTEGCAKHASGEVEACPLPPDPRAA